MTRFKFKHAEDYKSVVEFLNDTSAMFYVEDGDVVAVADEKWSRMISLTCDEVGISYTTR